MMEAATLACSYVDGLSQTSFLEDTRTQQAVLMNIVIIGESAAKILQSDEKFIASHSHIPWRQIAAMRHKVVHNYFGIDLEIIWETVQTDLPQLLASLHTILKTPPESPP